MVYTEERNINGRKYFYRVLSVRAGSKISKKRKYLGINLTKSELSKKEKEADGEIIPNKKSNKEIEKIKSKIKGILRKNKVIRAGIFGSYSRGEQKKNSDIDILVEIDDNSLSLIGFIRLIRLLEEKLKRKVDLLEYNAIKPRIRKRILEEEVKIL